MENAGGQQAESLEDQLRRMIVTNGTPQPRPDQPIVRLPPPSSHQQSQQSQSASNAVPYGNPPPWQGRKDHVPRQTPAAPHQHYQSSNFPPRQPQNGRSPNPHHPRHFRQAQFDHNQQLPPNAGPPPFSGSGPNQRGRFQHHMPLDPDAFQRGNFNGPPIPTNARSKHLFNPRASVPISPTDQHMRQTQHLEQIAATEISKIEMSPSERAEKEAFRHALQKICHEVRESHPHRLPRISLECFGSFKSGFASAGSDMDLVIVVEESLTPSTSASASSSACFSLLEDDLPRVLEKRLLRSGYGARLLTRTRVPIIKVCERPDSLLLEKLREEREKWDALSEEMKYPHLFPGANGVPKDVAGPSVDGVDGQADGTTVTAVESVDLNADVQPGADVTTTANLVNEVSPIVAVNGGANTPQPGSKNEARSESANAPQQRQKRDSSPPWTRERKAGPLDFPKTGVGIQSDINFFNPLGIRNTHLLTCYLLCDPRVRPMVLFVKAWAKQRKINSSYSGTLSSYGYVLMVLHYLVNIAQPPVLPNLQSSWRPRGYEDTTAPSSSSPLPHAGEVVDGWHVSFWSNADEILHAASQNLLTTNREPLGSLLAGFFHYYATQGGGRTFTWTQEVLSLRTIGGGLLTKEEKGWTKAVTEEGEGKKIQHRYLFCVEDPFELSHNVARTVTHKGIVAIRDEFRRAKRILVAVGNGVVSREGELFAPLVEVEETKMAAEEVKRGVHGIVGGADAAVANGVAPGHTAMPMTASMEPHAPQHLQQQQRSDSINLRPRGTNSQRGRPGRPDSRTQPPPQHPPPKSKLPDVTDNEAFPTLGGAGAGGGGGGGAPKSPKKKRNPRHKNSNHQNPPHAAGASTAGMGGKEEWGEISGEKAKRYLAEVKMRRDDAQMETMARGMAEAVLGDSD